MGRPMTRHDQADAADKAREAGIMGQIERDARASKGDGLTVYDFDKDDGGCVRLHVATDTPYSEAEGDRLSRKIEAVDDLLAVAHGLDRWESDPDRYAGDLADLAHKARAAIAKAGGGA